jgi:hypothetical protein
LTFGKRELWKEDYEMLVAFITSILKERDESIRKAVEAMDFNHGYSVKKRVLALLREKQ